MNVWQASIAFGLSCAALLAAWYAYYHSTRP